jgi:nitrite reductase (NADH) small subunit
MKRAPSGEPPEPAGPGRHEERGHEERWHEEHWHEDNWIDICALDDITPDTGVAALVAHRQVAIVRVGPGQAVYAVGNFDPFSHAFVIARGIVGDREGVPKIASPIYKQSFDLRTGQCLDDPGVRLPSYPVRVRDGRIAISIVSGKPQQRAP